MSVYLPRDKAGNPKTEIYQYDFRLRPKGAASSQRFFGSTGQRTEKAAERVEAELRELAKLGRLHHRLTVDEACTRYWEQKMQHTRSADDQARNLELLSRCLGPDTLLMDIDAAKIAEAAAKRAAMPLERYHRGRKELVATEIYPTGASVNRQIVETARRLLRHARTVWRIPIDLTDFDWAALKRPEAEGISREMTPAQEQRYWQALPASYHPIVEMYLISGRRKMDWVGLARDRVDLDAGTVWMPSRKKKRQGEIAVQLTAREAEILREEMAKAPDAAAVFTFEVRHGEDKGKRRPITSAGLRRAHLTARKRAGLPDLRIHDLRHTFGSRLMRETGNPKLVQQAMNHASITSTLRYVHALPDETLAARSRLQTYRISPGLHVAAKAQRKKRA